MINLIKVLIRWFMSSLLAPTHGWVNKWLESPCVNSVLAPQEGKIKTNSWNRSWQFPPLRLSVGVSWWKSDSMQDNFYFESALFLNVKILMLLWTHKRTSLENSKHFKLLELFLQWKFLPYGNKILPGKDRLMRISVCLLTVLRISMALVDI